MHFDDFAGVLHAQTIAELLRIAKQRTQIILAADQNGRAIGIPTQKIEDGRHGNGRTVVTAHAIYGNGYRHCENGRVRKHPAAFESTNYSPLALMTFLPR